MGCRLTGASAAPGTRSPRDTRAVTVAGKHTSPGTVLALRVGMVATSPMLGDKTVRVDKTERSHLRSKLDRLRLPALPSLPWLLLGLVLLGSTAFTYYGYVRHRIA